MPAEDPGAEMLALIRRLYPLPRSITGDGVRETLRILSEVAPVEVHEVPSGTRVHDWEVPREWNVREAWIADPSGRRVVDFGESSLHLVSYSVPVRRRMSLEELQPHLHSIPEHPEWIPYRTSYYAETWGFCLSQRTRDALVEGEYEVCIDATLEPGHLTFGEVFLPGQGEDEVLVSAHVCHPALCNDNLSGIAVAAHLARELAGRSNRYGYRFLFAPVTIGAITWLAQRADVVPRVAHGLSLVCLGDASPFTYKRTFDGSAAIDRAVAHVLEHSGRPHEVIDFFPYGYDERQFNAPGFRVPMGSLMRGRHGEFPEYHTSADSPDFLSGAQLADALQCCLEIVEVLEGDRRYRSLAPHGEPQLGKRGIYRAMGGEGGLEGLQMAMLWVLACADGSRSLLEVAERARLPFATVGRAAELLLEHSLLEPVAQGR